MKKRVLFFVIILTIQSILQSVSVFALDKEKEKAEIIKIIEEINNNYSLRNLEGIMRHISLRYSDSTGKEIIDYNKLSLRIEKELNELSKTLINFSWGNLKVIEFIIQDSEAMIKVEFNYKGFNMNEKRDVMGKGRMQLNLIKEDNIWKIIRWN